MFGGLELRAYLRDAVRCPEHHVGGIEPALAFQDVGLFDQLGAQSSELAEDGIGGDRWHRSGIHHDLEAAVKHALAVEGHVLRVAHFGDARIFHDGGVHLVAVSA
jgi:hypothetical protein